MLPATAVGQFAHARHRAIVPRHVHRGQSAFAATVTTRALSPTALRPAERIDVPGRTSIGVARSDKVQTKCTLSPAAPGDRITASGRAATWEPGSLSATSMKDGERVGRRLTSTVMATDVIDPIRFRFLRRAPTRPDRVGQQRRHHARGAWIVDEPDPAPAESPDINVYVVILQQAGGAADGPAGGDTLSMPPRRNLRR